jgi:hypothetical protein
MNARDRTVQIIAGIALIIGLVASGVLASAVSAEAGRSQLVYSDRATEGDPPEVAVGVAMGAFRGLFVNYLWLRATRLKDEGKYHEAVQLSEAITRLQPRFPRVWAFHAWNMAYNISVATKTREERWEWVKAGIDLLRSEGIPKNPNELLLYKELAWIFIHKVQGFQDDANRYYKRRLAEEWTVVLGIPPVLPEDREQAVEEMANFIRPIAEAPDTLQGVIDRELAIRNADRFEDELLTESDSKVAELVGRIESETELQLDEGLLRVAAVSLEIRGAIERAEEAGLGDFSGQLRRTISARANRFNVLNEVIDELIFDPEFREAWDLLLPHVRKRVVVDEYHMNPAQMLQFIETFGPLDFRHPGAHAIYWSALGVQNGLTRESVTQFNTLNTDRITVQSIQELFRSGDVTYDLVTDTHYTMFNLHFASAYGDVLAELVERGGRSQDRSQRIYTTYAQGYLNFCANVCRVMYQLGRTEEAQHYFNEYANSEWINLNDFHEDVYAAMSLDEFVAHLIQNDDRLSIPHVAASEAAGAVRTAFIRGLLRNDRVAFERSMQYARTVHNYYFQAQDVRTLVDADFNRMDEMPPDFAILTGEVLFQIITSGTLNEVDAALLYERAPESIRALVYDRIEQFFKFRGYPEDVIAQLFPEPPGMEFYRQQQARLEALYRQIQGNKEDILFYLN